MAATLELKYFNSYWLKKLSNVVDENPSAPSTPYADVPQAYANDNANDWYIEEARIRGGYNNTITDLGVKAHIVEDNPNNQNRFNTIIYSGVFNSRTGINQTNEFSVGEDITRSVDPAHGDIQKLYAEDTNLIIFQENKINRALIDKDAIYTAEGTALTTSGRLVIGQIVPYKGEYGISTDPLSFALYGYRKYFTDKKRGCVLRLSTTGEIVEISSYGMHDFFRDQLSATTTRIVGGWDMHTKNYILSIQTASGYKTLSFDESVSGWTSFLTYQPSWMLSLGSNFFTTNSGKIYKHYTNTLNVNNAYSSFYGVVSDSNVTVILNSDPSVIKVFKTINYEGSDSWTVSTVSASSGDIGLVPISGYITATSLAAFESEIFANRFKRKENKYFANIINNSPASNGEVVFGASMTGIKGFFSTMKFSLNNNLNERKELFAVSSDTVESSY